VNASDIIAHINQRLGKSYRIVGDYAAGESGTASRVIDDLENRFVLKIGQGSEFRAENAARTIQRLCARGYPAPEYVAVGSVERTSYSLQRVMPGEPIGSRLHLGLLPQLLHLNDLQRGQGESPNDEPERIIRGVMEGYVDFCILDTLRTYSCESAAMLDTLQGIVAAHARECPRRNDIVHFDFHTNNILIYDQRLSGVIDWEGSESGDCAFDLATLLFYTWPFADFREALWRALLERTNRGMRAVYLAHMIVRQLDWSMRHHDVAIVRRYMDNANEIIHVIDQP
jgi:hypothetical protein